MIYLELSHLSMEDRIAYHDIYWHGVSNPFELGVQKYPPWSQLSGPIEVALDKRDNLLAKHPNMLFLAHVVSTYTMPRLSVYRRLPPLGKGMNQETLLTHAPRLT